MITPAIPNAKVPIADKGGLATYAWQRFFLALQQAGGSISAIVNGKTITVASLEFGAGFEGTQSGDSLLLTSGLTIVDNGDTLAGVNTIALEGPFGVEGSGQSVTITSPAGAIAVAQNGVIKSQAAGLLNFLGNCQVAIVGNKAYISVGTAIIESDGTSIATASTLNFGTLFKVTGAEDYAEIDFAGLTAFQGTASLGQFIDLDLGQGVVGSIGTGSLAGTLSLSGTGMEFISGASTVSGVFEAVAGAGVSFLETASGTITINAPGLISAVHGTNGVSASIASGTLDLSGTLLELIEGTTTLTGILGLVAGANVSITGTSGGLGTLAVLSTAASGFYYGGTLFTALAAGSNITLTPSGTTLVASGAAGGGGVTYPQIVQSASIESGGTLVLPNPVTVGNYLAVFVNQDTALANFDGVPLLQTAGSATGQTFLFGQVATSTTSPSLAIAGNGYIAEISGSSSHASSVVTMGAKNGETIPGNTSVSGGSILLFATAPLGGSYDDTVMVAPPGATWLASGQLTSGQAYGFGVYSVPCPATNANFQVALRTGQNIPYAAVLELTH